MKEIRLAIFACTWLSLVGMSLGQSPTQFTYQGRLSATNQPANGYFDLRFSLFASSNGSDAIGNSTTNPSTLVVDGVFTAILDFGAGSFPGDSRWLEIAVRLTGSTDAFQTLHPRQLVTAAPYAIRAMTVADGTVTADKLSATNGQDGQVLKLNGGLLTWSTTETNGVTQATSPLSIVNSNTIRLVPGGTLPPMNAVALTNLARDHLAATDFGAATDGVDNRAAIQATLDAAKAGDRGEVWLPRGSFAVSGPLYLPRGITLRGGGDYHGDKRTKLIFSGTHGVIATNSYQVAIIGLELAGTQTAGTGGICISNGNNTFPGEDVRIEQCAITGFDYNVITHSPTRVNIEGNDLLTPLTANVLFQGLTDSTKVYRNTISGGNHGVGAIYKPNIICAAGSAARALIVELNELGDANPHLVVLGSGNNVTWLNNTHERNWPGTNHFLLKGIGGYVISQNRFGDANTNALIRCEGIGSRLFHFSGLIGNLVAHQHGGSNYGQVLLMEDAGNGDFTAPFVSETDGIVRFGYGGPGIWSYYSANRFRQVNSSSRASMYPTIGNRGLILTEVNGPSTSDDTLWHVGYKNGVLGKRELLVAGGALGGNGSGITNATGAILAEDAPAGPDAAGIKGQIRFDGNYLYICTDTNTWRRVPVSSW